MYYYPRSEGSWVATPCWSPGATSSSVSPSTTGQATAHCIEDNMITQHLLQQKQTYSPHHESPCLTLHQAHRPQLRPLHLPRLHPGPTLQQEGQQQHHLHQQQHYHLPQPETPSSPQSPPPPGQVLAEQLSSSYHLLADAIISLTVARCGAFLLIEWFSLALE